MARLLHRTTSLPRMARERQRSDADRAELRAWLDNDHRAEGYTVAFCRVRVGALFIHQNAYWQKTSDTQAREIPQTSTYPHKYPVQPVCTFADSHAVMVTKHDHIDFSIPALPHLEGLHGARRDEPEDIHQPMGIQVGPSINWQAYWHVRIHGSDPWEPHRSEVDAKPIHPPSRDDRAIKPQDYRPDPFGEKVTERFTLRRKRT